MLGLTAAAGRHAPPPSQRAYAIRVALYTLLGLSLLLALAGCSGSSADEIVVKPRLTDVITYDVPGKPDVASGCDDRGNRVYLYRRGIAVQHDSTCPTASR